MEQAIINQNSHWNGKRYQNLQERNLYDTLLSNMQTKHIQILTGIRRSGKSSFFRMLINELMEQANPKSMLLLNMDDPLYFDVWENPAMFYNLIELAEKLTGEKVKYLFIDEAQAVKGWETFVKSVYDSEIFTKIFVTGSNSSFLQNEYSTLLSGRYLENSVFPYSFKEMLQHRGIRSYLDLASATPEVLRLLDDCLEWGCFPEIRSLKNSGIKSNLLKSYFDSIVMKDCVSRYAIADVAMFKKLLLYSVSNAGSVYSYKSLGTAIGSNENTAKKYINILNDSYIIQDVSNFAFSLKENVRNSHKIYIADTGLINAISYRFWDNKAKLFENFVFNELQKQKNDEITFINNNGECDFLVKNGLDFQAFQVCYELTPTNQKRECAGFDKICLPPNAVSEQVTLKRKIILTYNQEEQIGEIEVIPAWKYFF
jgi:predicted AAA+ superfamily ATPase